MLHNVRWWGRLHHAAVLAPPAIAAPGHSFTPPPHTHTHTHTPAPKALKRVLRMCGKDMPEGDLKALKEKRQAGLNVSCEQLAHTPAHTHTRTCG